MKQKDVDCHDESESNDQSLKADKRRTSIYKEELQELREKAAKADEYLEDLRRLKAEFDNFRKRWAKERQAIAHYGEEELIGELLTTIDNFERAIAAAKEAGQDGPLLEGVVLVHDQMIDILRSRGLQRISSTGTEFDPNFHEAVSQEITDEVPDNHVIGEVQPGYKFRDRLLRPAKVRVAKTAH
ncbi:MAG TPA: nucleotide exchange factor GrpE [bacterium]|nr:nucleotide exchange factor GrpE [bacterium]